MQRKDLALRVLSTAAIMSIVTSIAAPAFADIYYIGNGSIDVETITSTDGKQQYVKVTQGNKTYTDTSNEIVIKDGIDEDSATQREDSRIEGKRAEVAVPDKERTDTQELEAAGPAAGESQPDPDAGFTLNETEEDSAQNQEGKDITKKDEDTTEPSTDNPTENPKKDVVYEYAPADPNPEQQATKPALSTPEEPEATAPEATQANAPAADPTTPTAPAADPPAEGSVKNPTTNVINVVNNWVGKAAKELKIRLSNVNIKVSNREYGAAMDISGGGKTKIELDGQNRLDNSQAQANAGLRKQGEGTLTITDETDDNGNKITAPKSGDSGSLTAKGATSNGSAGIGGKTGESTKNIIIEGYATVDATGGGQGAGIGGGGGTAGHVSGDAENIIIRGHSNVTATSCDGAAIGGGSSFSHHSSGSATGIWIYGHATVNASTSGNGAAIGAADGNRYAEAEVTIGTDGATAEQEDVHVTATSKDGAAIGNGNANTKVIIQGHTTIENAFSKYGTAIGGNYYANDSGDMSITIRDNATIKKAEVSDEAANLGKRPAIGASYANKLVVNIEGNAHLETVKGVIGTTGSGVKDAVINIKDNAHIDTIEGGSNAIGGESGDGKTVTVNIDGGENGNVRLDNVESGSKAAISGTSINIGDHVLIKLKQKFWKNNSGDKQYSQYLSENNAEKELTTVGDNTALWYTDYNNKLQKIVHGKNLCKKSPKQNITQQPTCTEPGSADCTCDYEHTNGAARPSCNRTWTDKVPALGHDWDDWQVTTPATCTKEGVETRYCKHDHSHVETRPIPATGHHWVDNGDGTHTCTKCGATEALPSDTNSALELRVVDAEGMNEPFTVSQNGTLRTYTRRLRHCHPYRRPGHPALPAGPRRTDHPVRHQWPDQQLCHQRPAGTGQRQRGVLPHPPWGRRAHPAAGGGRPQRTGERLTIPGGGASA